MSEPVPAIGPMPWLPVWQQRFLRDARYLERCLRQYFYARDVMEELRAFDERQDAREVRGFLEAESLLVAGISRQGRIHACCRVDQLGDGPCGSFAAPIAADFAIGEEEPLLSVIQRLGEREFLIVRGIAGYTGYIAHCDLQKPPVRMFLFAVVSIVELRWQEWIRDHFGSADGWRACLGPARLEMARKLMEERNRNGHCFELVDCLQFSDRATIVMKTPELWARTLFTSKSEARERIRAIQQLRDDLAHSQDLLAADWETMLGLARMLEPLFQQLKARAEGVVDEAQGMSHDDRRCP